MPFQLANLYVASHALLFAATKTTTAKSSSSSGTLLLLVVVLGAGGYFIMRPRRKRMIDQQQAQRQIAVGDEVITTSGIYGRVISLYDDRAQLEIAPGTRIEIARASIVRTIPPSPTGDGMGDTGGPGWSSPPPSDPPTTPGSDGLDDPPGGFS